MLRRLRPAEQPRLFIVLQNCSDMTQLEDLQLQKPHKGNRQQHAGYGGTEVSPASSPIGACLNNFAIIPLQNCLPAQNLTGSTFSTRSAHTADSVMSVRQTVLQSILANGQPPSFHRHEGLAVIQAEDRAAVFHPASYSSLQFVLKHNVQNLHSLAISGAVTNFANLMIIRDNVRVSGRTSRRGRVSIFVYLVSSSYRRLVNLLVTRSSCCPGKTQSDLAAYGYCHVWHTCVAWSSLIPSLTCET